MIRCHLLDCHIVLFQKLICKFVNGLIVNAVSPLGSVPDVAEWNTLRIGPEANASRPRPDAYRGARSDARDDSARARAKAILSFTSTFGKFGLHADRHGDAVQTILAGNCEAHGPTPLASLATLPTAHKRSRGEG